jgi:hypothetical protein
MGASAWSYFAPYQRDAFAALEALRWKVFREGDYFKSSRVFLDFDEFIEHDPSIWGDEHSLGIWEAWYAEVVEELREHVGSPDALRWHNGSEGTHSIIDITWRSQLHELSSDAVKQLFGTTKPTRDDVTKVDVIASTVGRNHCAYFNVYLEGEPSEIFFFGFSGD